MYLESSTDVVNDVVRIFYDRVYGRMVLIVTAAVKVASVRCGLRLAFGVLRFLCAGTIILIVESQQLNNGGFRTVVAARFHFFPAKKRGKNVHAGDIPDG